VADALGAQIRVYLIDLVALVDGPIGALGLAHIAVDALVGNQKRHGDTPRLSKRILGKRQEA
jgi:hypothetical protein